MKLAIRGICVVALALTLVALAVTLSVANPSAASALTRVELAAGLVNLGGKLAILGALIGAFGGGQRGQWRWVVALSAGAAITLFSGPISALTNTGPDVYFIGPILTSGLALAYTFRMRDLASSKA